MLAQLVDGVILKGRLTPQAPGRPAMRLGWRPGMLLAELTKQLQVAWRSGVVLAVKKDNGDTLEYNQFCSKELRPALKDIVWTSPAEINSTPA